MTKYNRVGCSPKVRPSPVREEGLKPRTNGRRKLMERKHKDGNQVGNKSAKLIYKLEIKMLHDKLL